MEIVEIMKTCKRERKVPLQELNNRRESTGKYVCYIFMSLGMWSVRWKLALY